MEILTVKGRIAVLWVFGAVAMSAHSVLLITEPGGLEWMISQSEAMGSAAFLLVRALLRWIPLVMAFLSMTLKDSANRWTNMILGVVFTVFNIYHLTLPCVGSRAHQWLIVGSTVVVTALIAWYAWNWPKEEA